MSENEQLAPVEVLFTAMFSIIVLAFLILTMGTFTDGFMDAINKLDFPLSIWGQTMMNLLVIRYSHWVFIVPGFFGLLIFIWAVKSIIKKHDYTTPEDEYIDDNYT